MRYRSLFGHNHNPREHPTKIKKVSRYLVRRVPAEGVLVNVPRELDVGPAAVELLLVLDRQLQHEVLPHVGEGLAKLRRQPVKPVA